MVDEKEILKDLLVDESEIIKQLADLVKFAKNYFVIEQKSGKVIFKKFKELTNQAKICTLLIGKKFAVKLDLPTDDSLTISQIGDELGIPVTTLSWPMKELVKKRYISKNGKKYEIMYNRLPEIFSDYFHEA